MLRKKKLRRHIAVNFNCLHFVKRLLSASGRGTLTSQPIRGTLQLSGVACSFSLAPFASGQPGWELRAVLSSVAFLSAVVWRGTDWFHGHAHDSGHEVVALGRVIVHVVILTGGASQQACPTSSTLFRGIEKRNEKTSKIIFKNKSKTTQKKKRKKQYFVKNIFKNMKNRIPKTKNFLKNQKKSKEKTKEKISKKNQHFFF